MTDFNKTLSDIDIVMNLLKYGRTRAAMTTLRALRETTLTSMGDECAVDEERLHWRVEILNNPHKYFTEDMRNTIQNTRTS